ncbi:MAG: hypothetical protein EB161_08380 [Nitrosopumilaceae archaeon]|nr:hypothetical protein [Nitrosopumilaceae archaeon]
MISKLAVALLATLVVIPAYAQQYSNPSLILQTISVPSDDFNKIHENLVIVPLEKEHSGSWQITIENHLLYANPKGNAILRIYDATIKDKFVEIGMGSLPDRQFWVAVNLPGQGYLTPTRIDKDGWSPDSKVIAAYGDAAGLSIGNGKRIVASNLPVSDFVVGSYAVYGMDEVTDPPAINSGTYTVEVLSGDIGQNPLHYYPFAIAGGIGALIGFLLLTKRRSL